MTLDSIVTTIKHYWLVASTFIVAILAYIILRKDSKIKDLQREIILDKTSAQLGNLITKTKEDTDTYDKALKDYQRLRDSYTKLYGPLSK